METNYNENIDDEQELGAEKTSFKSDQQKVIYKFCKSFDKHYKVVDEDI
jgi:hypothetical protein